MKHKPCDIIKAWAEGEPVQHYSEKDNKWIDNTRPTWSLECEWRIKPKEEFLKYKNALLKFSDGSVHIHAYYPRDYERIEVADYFVSWIGDEQTVNVGWLR